uniref:Nuclear receptor n=1 Tax=Panagrellus redivivus TaxID=6233 RepID=A0A7E4VT37_PANRE
MQPPNYCLVCGDPAKYYNYNVPSCAGCRIFFRRAVIDVRTYGCNSNGICKVKGKNYCRQCRFDQCIRVGMNPAGINLPKNGNKKAVFDLIDSRKRVIATTNLLGLPSMSSSPEMPYVPTKMASITLPQLMEYRDVDFLLFLESKVCKLRQSTFRPDYLFTVKITDIIKKESELGNADRYESIQSSTASNSSQQNSPFKTDIMKTKLVLQQWTALDLLLSIEMAKILPVFAKLEHNDKERFIRNTYAIVTLFTRSYYSYEKRSDVIIYPDGTMPISLPLNTPRSITKLENDVMLRSTQPVKRIDLTREEYVLLKAMLFCNPAGEDNSDAGKRILEEEYERYSKTLLRYMQSIHGDTKGASRYAQVLLIMEAMLYFAERTQYCLICGVPTKHYHYYVPSCMACRLFFRRTVISGRNYGCSQNSVCEIKGKNSCRQCRFDQCIRVGMNPAGIKFAKNVNVSAVSDFVESRKRFIDASTDKISFPSTSSLPDILPIIPVKMASIILPQPMEYRDVDFLLFLESKVRKLRECSFNPEYMFTSSLTEIIEKGSELGNADRYDNNTNWLISKDSCQNSVFEADVLNTMRVLQHWVALDLLLSVVMAKVLPVYAKLEHNDKESLVRNTYAIVTLFTRCYYSYEKRSDVTIYPDGTKPISLFLNTPRCITKLESEVLIRCIQPVKRINLTKEEYLLLKALLFCNPACENISDAGRELLRKESERYSQTLLRYMQSIHGDAKGASRYAQVIAVIEAMFYFAMRTREYQLLWVVQRAEQARRLGREFPRVCIIEESF